MVKCTKSFVKHTKKIQPAISGGLLVDRLVGQITGKVVRSLEVSHVEDLEFWATCEVNANPLIDFTVCNCFENYALHQTTDDD